MRKILRGLILALIMALGFSVGSLAATYHGFVHNKFYLVLGGTPATFEEVATTNDPLEVFRSQLAYDNLRAHIGAAIGMPLSDSDFRSLLLSDDVRLTPCIGEIETSGVTDSGHFGWHKRDCYADEMLIQVRLQDGRWLIVASQGCYNPVRGEVPSLPPPPPPPTPVAQKELVCELKLGPPVITKEDTVYYSFDGRYVCINGNWFPVETQHITIRGNESTSQEISSDCNWE